MNVQFLPAALSLVLCLSNASVANAEKEGGGGSYQRLIQRAGLESPNEVYIKRAKNLETYQGGKCFLDENCIRGLFLKAADDFLKILTSRIKTSEEFVDAMGARAVMSPEHVKNVKAIIKELKSKKKELIIPLSYVGSLESGESVTAVNLPSAKKVYLGYQSFRTIYRFSVPKLRIPLSVMMVGHELLSLIKIENVTNYAVSSTLLREFVTDTNAISWSCTSEDSSKKVQVTGDLKTLEFTSLNFDWPKDISENKAFEATFDWMPHGGSDILKYSTKTIPTFDIYNPVSSPSFGLQFKNSIGGEREHFFIPEYVKFLCRAKVPGPIPGHTMSLEHTDI